MKSKSIIPVLILSLALFSGCSANTGNSAKPEEKPIAVSVSDIQKTKIENIRTIVGKAKPVQEVSVFARIPGKVSKVFADVGQSVKKGQALFSLEDKDIKLQVSQAESALNAAKANLDRTDGGAMEMQLAQLKSSLATAELNMKDVKTAYENTKALYDAGAVSKQNLDSAELRYKTSTEQYNTAKKAKELTEAKINKENIAAVEAQVQQAQAAYELANSQLDNITVTSPVDGFVSVRSVDEGELVSSAMPAFAIVDLSSVVVEITVMEEMANKLAVGNKFDILIKTSSDKPYMGEVASISPNADPKTQTYLAKLLIPNPDRKLKGGMLAEVKLVTEAKDNVLVVPIDAVIDENGKKIIYVINGEEALRKEVVVGLTNDRFIEVSGQINENDKVIVKGQTFIKDKTKISVVS